MKSIVTIVTGAARGIGAAIADRLIKARWHVAGFDRVWPKAQGNGLAARLPMP